MNQNSRLADLLRFEVAQLQAWLDDFEPSNSGRRRRAVLGRTFEYVIVQALPLPDGYRPDELDVLLIVDHFPSMPPIGMYVLNQNSGRVIRQLQERFNAFENRAFHDAPPVEGYTWLCYAYADNTWRYNGADPRRGDNLRKFLASFFAEAAL